MLCLATTRWAFYKNKPVAFVLLGIVCGYAASVRLMNIIVVVPIYLFLLFDIVQNVRNKKVLLQVIQSSGLYILAFALALYIFWPTLWQHPFAAFAESYHSLSYFRWFGGLLMDGKLYETINLPWFYIPIWFCVTVPEVYLLTGFTGIILLVTGFIKAPSNYINNTEQRNLLLYCFCFLAPVLAVILLHSVVYDDWRHLYFIYPPFIMLAAFTLSALMKTKAAGITSIIMGTQVGMVAMFMIRNHPNQQVYFNTIVAHQKERIINNYELDYWGASYKQALEWILNHDTSEKILLNYEDIIVQNAAFLPPVQAQRFEFTAEKGESKYHLQHFRTKPYLYPVKYSVHDIKVYNSPILRIAMPMQKY